MIRIRLPLLIALPWCQLAGATPWFLLSVDQGSASLNPTAAPVLYVEFQ